MRTLILTILIILFASSFRISYAELSKKGPLPENDTSFGVFKSKRVEFEINLNKPVYFESEPVWLEAKLRFRSRPLFSSAPHLDLLSDLDVTIINEKGDTVTDYGGNADYYSPASSVDSIYYVENLLLFFGSTEYPYSQMVMRHYLPEGIYKLCALLRTSEEPGDTEYIPPLELRFTVTPAQGDEKESRDALISMYKLLGSEDKNSAAVELMQSIESFKLKHPASVYLGAVLNLYSSYRVWSSSGLFADSLNRIILQNIYRYPESYFNYVNLLSLILRYDDRDEADELLKKLTTQYHGTLLGKFAGEIRFTHRSR